MEQITILEFLQQNQIGLKVKEKVKDNVLKTLGTKKKNKNLRLNKDYFQSYKIEIGQDGKIKSIKFYFWDKSHKKGKFEILIKDYFIEKKKVKEPYGGNYTIISISKLKIGKIGKKLKNGYEYRNNINQYQNEFGIRFKETQEFILYILKEYHKKV